MRIVLNRKLLSHFDWGLLGAIVLVPVLGLIVLFSADYDPEGRTALLLGLRIPSPAFVKQVSFLGIGFVVLAVALAMPHPLLQRLTPWIYCGGIALLVGVLSFGTVINGARRWFDLGPLRLQPAEFMKVAIVLVVARYVSKHPPKPGGYTLVQLIPPLFLLLLPMALIKAQPDLGTALVLGLIGVAMILFVGVRFGVLCIGVLVLAVVIPSAWHFLHDYQKQRVMVLFNAEADPLGRGYHIIQSKIAVGSGGIAGKGYLHGTQSQLEFLPEHNTDFIFSVLSEEWGFFGCAVVLLVYLILLYRLLRVVARGKDLYACALAFGAAAMIFLHTVINVGMVVGIFPVVGIPLPLFSYGGSSVITTMSALGLALGVSMRRFMFLARV